DGGLLAGCHPQLSPHLDGGARGLEGMVSVFEEKEQRVAPEFEHGTASPVNDVEHSPEDAAEDGRQLLCADPTTGGETLGEVGEAGDVDEQQGPLHLGPTARPESIVPLERDPRHVALEPCGLGDQDASSISGYRVENTRPGVDRLRVPW